MENPLIYRTATASSCPSVGAVGSFATAIAACAALLLIAGCRAIQSGSSSITSEATLSGRVRGGNQPIVGATITLYAPGAAGYGSAPTAIVSAVTDSGGGFSLPRPYTCPANSPITYLVAAGGNPGAGVNPALKEVALLPACSSLTASTSVIISEASTVAAAYALAPFASISGTTTNIGTSSTNLLGIANVLGPARNLVSTAAGQANSAIPGLVLPTAELNTLADILSACVNTNTVAGTSTTCSTLFAAATPPGGATPTDTFQAAIDIALNPGNNPAALFTLSSAIAPFQPTLAAAPSDFAIGIGYNGGPIAASGGTAGVDIDAQGDAWAPVFYNSPAHSSVAEISPSGALLSGASGFLSGGTLGIPQSIAIDGQGSIFIADLLGSDVAVLDSTGVSSSYLQPPSVNGAAGLALDNRNSTIWITDPGSFFYSGTNVTHMTTSGTEAIGSPYGGGSGPIGVAVDASEAIWVLNSDNGVAGNGYLTRYTPSGSSYTAQNFFVGTATFPFDLAIDHAGNVWVADYNGAVSEFANDGTRLSPASGYPLNPVTSPNSIMVDGLGRAWISNTAIDAHGHPLNVPGSVAVFSNSGTLLSSSTTATPAGSFLGYTAGGTIPQQPYFSQGLKIDASGNLWVTGFNATGSQTVTELVGIAAPVVTPLSFAAANNGLGIRP